MPFGRYGTSYDRSAWHLGRSYAPGGPRTVLSRAVAAWKSSTYDAANTRLTDLTGSGRHLSLVAGKYLDYSGSTYLYIAGRSGDNASCADSVALSVTGDIDLRVKCALDDWTPTTNATLIAKTAAGVGNGGVRPRPRRDSGHGDRLLGSDGWDTPS